MAFDDRGDPRPCAVVVSERLVDVYRRIEESDRDPSQVKIVAVTKGHGTEVVAAAIEAGLVDIGENYANELLEKASYLRDIGQDRAAVGERAAVGDHGYLPGDLAWHFLGSIQRNKVRRLARFVSCWQGVYRRSEGEEIVKYQPGAQVFIQVKDDSALHRNGCELGQASALLKDLKSIGINVIGLMTVGVLARSESELRLAFRTVRRLADELGLQECSMGMSSDYELALKEGSTMIRLGTALFGPRLDQKGLM